MIPLFSDPWTGSEKTLKTLYRKIKKPEGEPQMRNPFASHWSLACYCARGAAALDLFSDETVVCSQPCCQSPQSTTCCLWCLWPCSMFTTLILMVALRTRSSSASTCFSASQPRFCPSCRRSRFHFSFPIVYFIALRSINCKQMKLEWDMRKKLKTIYNK